MIRKYLTFALLISASAAMAADAKNIDLDGGVTIQLDSGWKAERIANPAMKMASMRDMLEGASDTRIEKRGTGVLVTFIHFKTKEPKPEEDPEIARAAHEDTVKKAAARYLPNAVETEVSVETVERGKLSITLATLHAREGAKFNVRAGYPGGCVTTGSIKKGAAVHVVSVASDSCDSGSHQQAVAALYAAEG